MKRAALEMTQGAIAAGIVLAILGPIITVWACAPPQKTTLDSLEHAHQLQQCVKTRPIAECHRELCKLYPDARTCGGELWQP